MKSVVIAKIEAPGLYSSAGIVKAFAEHFEEVHEFNYQNIMYNEGVDDMRRRLMGMCMMYSPDVCFLHIQTPEPLSMDLIQFLSERTFVVLYTFDVRNDISWYKEYAPYVGLILFGDGESIESCRIEGINNVDYLQSSADFDFYKPFGKGEGTDLDYGEIVFVGNNHLGSNTNFPLAEQRVDMVNFMKEEFGDRFKVWGLGWQGSQMLNPSQERTVYRTCKIAITHNNYLRTGYTSDRLWRSIGCGAFTISQYFEPYGAYDIPSRALPMWSTFKDLADYCRFFLDPQWESHKNGIIKEQMEFLKKNGTWSHRISNLKKLIIKHGYDKRMENIRSANTGS